MNNSKEELTTEELRKKAYLAGLRLKNSGLDSEAIYARLEKEGLPEDLAKEVSRNVLIEIKKDTIKQAKVVYEFAWIRVAAGVALASVSYLVTGNVILPIGIIVGGLVAAVLAKKKMEE